MLRTTIAGIKLESCIYNASGPKATDFDSLTIIAHSHAGAIVTKTATTTAKTNGHTTPQSKTAREIIDMGRAYSETLVARRSSTENDVDHCEYVL